MLLPQSFEIGNSANSRPGCNYVLALDSSFELTPRGRYLFFQFRNGPIKDGGYYLYFGIRCHQSGRNKSIYQATLD